MSGVFAQARERSFEGDNPFPPYRQKSQRDANTMTKSAIKFFHPVPWALAADFFPLVVTAFLLFVSALPATGQSTHSFNSGMNCYGVYRLPDTSTRPYKAAAGDDSYYQPVISSPSYKNNGDGTTTDNVTGLMWVRSGTADTYTWANALSSCAVTMNSGSGFAGYKDWRLPNLRELLSIVDYGAAAAPFINKTAFPNTQSNYYWSSTPSEVFPASALAWDVTFTDGSVNGHGRTVATYCVRCVRNGP